MATDFRNHFIFSGPSGHVSRLAQEITAIAHKQPDGEYLVEVAHFPNCPGSMEWFYLDNIPVRQVDGDLILDGYSRSNPPLEFLESVSRQYPDLECCLTTLVLIDGLSMRWRSQGGQTELVEQLCSAFIGEEIFEWQKQGLVWNWTNNRAADIEMMRAFVSLEHASETDELQTACQFAYDALAYPATILSPQANSYVYSLACTIADYRHALISPRRECDCGQEDLHMGGGEKLGEDEFEKGLEDL